MQLSLDVVQQFAVGGDVLVSRATAFSAVGAICIAGVADSSMPLAAPPPSGSNIL